MFADMVNRATIAPDTSGGHPSAVAVQTEKRRDRPLGRAMIGGGAVGLLADRLHLKARERDLDHPRAQTTVPLRLLKALMKRFAEGADE